MHTNPNIEYKTGSEHLAPESVLHPVSPVPSSENIVSLAGHISPANDSLAAENGKLHVPDAKLSFPAVSTEASIAGAEPAETDIAHDSLAGICQESLAETWRTLDLNSRPHSYINVNDGSGYAVRSHGANVEEAAMMVLRHQTMDEFLEAHEHTLAAIGWFRKFREDVSGLADSTLNKGDRYLYALFTTPLFDDSLLGIRRPLTLPEVGWPEYGKLLVYGLYRALVEDLGLEEVAYDWLRTLRVFMRFICDGGAALDSGINLRQIWGPLVCPIADGDLPKRKPKSLIVLPFLEAMESIFEGIIDWAQAAKTHRAAAFRTAACLIGSLDSGLRGVEERGLLLAQQTFDRTRPFTELRNPLNVYSAKGGDPRLVLFEPYGFDFMNYYLRRWRPELTDDLEGYFYPRERGAELPSGTFSKAAKRLLDHLKERHLLDESFTFHSARKTFCTHWIERGGDLGQLQLQCGWKNTGMLATYWLPAVKQVVQHKQHFAAELLTRAA